MLPGLARSGSADAGASRAIEAARSVAAARSMDHRDRKRDNTSAYLLGGGFTVVALLLAASAGIPHTTVWLDIVLVAIVYSITSRVVFESAGGDAMAAQSVFVVAVFVLPLAYVPLTILIGVTLAWLAGRPELSWSAFSAEALAGWHTLGPVAVLAAVQATPPATGHWPWYLLALAAQFAIDGLVAVVRCNALGISTTSLVGPLRWTFAVDALLAPVGLAAVLASSDSSVALALACTPVGLLALLARDRAEHLEQAVSISAAYEQALTLATTDSLTELANRRAWTEATARAAIEHAADPMSRQVMILIADLDGLKAVNDTHGHDAGDELLQAAADVLRRAAPHGSVVARLGGDEFGILVVGGAGSGDDLAARVRRGAERHPLVRGHAVSLSIGMAACPPLTSVEDALVEADAASAADKSARRVQRN